MTYSYVYDLIVIEYPSIALLATKRLSLLSTRQQLMTLAIEGNKIESLLTADCWIVAGMKLKPGATNPERAGNQTKNNRTRLGLSFYIFQQAYLIKHVKLVHHMIGVINIIECRLSCALTLAHRIAVRFIFTWLILKGPDNIYLATSDLINTVISICCLTWSH